jgi:hypothetical protein
MSLDQAIDSALRPADARTPLPKLGLFLTPSWPDQAWPSGSFGRNHLGGRQGLDRRLGPNRGHRRHLEAAVGRYGLGEGHRFAWIHP